jgi:hypothetical protein
MTKNGIDPFLKQLKRAIGSTLKNPEASEREKQMAVANGIRLAMIEHRIRPDEEGSYFDVNAK